MTAITASKKYFDPNRILKLNSSDFGKKLLYLGLSLSFLLIAGCKGNLEDTLNTKDVQLNSDGIILSRNQNITLSEDGSSDTIGLELGGVPTETVSIQINSDNPGEISVSPATVKLDKDNWNLPQVVTLSGVEDDSSVDGDQLANIQFTVTSSDEKFKDITIPSFSVTNADNDQPGIIISNLPANVQEGDPSFDLDIALSAKPSADVTVNLSPDANITLATASFVFTPTDWNTTQSFTVTVVDDAVYEFDHNGIIAVSMTSSDSNFNGYPVADTSINLKDNDLPNPPAGLDLATADDSGLDNTDDITKFTTNLTITGTTIANGTVRLYETSSAGALLQTTSSDASGNFSADISLSANTTTDIVATVSDGNGFTSVDSTALTITTDTTVPLPPSGLDLATADDSGISSTDNITSLFTNLTISGTTEANARIELYSGSSSGTLLQTTTADGAGAFSVDISLPADASTNIVAVAIDSIDNRSSDSAALTIITDNTAPTTPLALNLDASDDTGFSSTDNITDTTANLTINGTAEANSTVRLYSGSSAGTLLQTTTADGVGNFTADITLPADSITNVVATSTDAVNNVSVDSAALSITTDNTTPNAPLSLDLATADDSGIFNSDNLTNQTSNLTISGLAEANATVRLYIGSSAGTLLQTTTADGAGNFSADITLPANATSDVVATASDAISASTDSTALSITTDTDAPLSPGIPDLETTSDSGSSNVDDITNITTPSFTASCDIGNTVQLYADTVATGSSVSCTTGSVTLTAATLSEGVRSITATQTDDAGNTGPSSGILLITIDTTTPVLTSLDWINDAADTYLNQTEVANALNAVSLNELGSDTQDYSIEADGTVCDAAVTYGLASTPQSLNFNALSGVYKVCVSLQDLAGNTSYGGTTTSVTVDTSPPSFTSLDWINDGADNFLNAGEATNATDIVTLGASGYDSANYAIENSGTTCDNLVSYGITSTPQSQDFSVNGTKKICVELRDLANNITYGSTSTDIEVDTIAPSGYNVSFSTSYVNASNEANASFNFTGAEIGSQYFYTIDDTNGGTTAITGNGTIATATDTISAIDVSSLDDDTLTLTVYLIDSSGNQGGNSTDTILKDSTPPTVSFVTASNADGTYLVGQNITVQVNFTENTIVDTGGGTPYLTLDTGANTNYSSGSGGTTLNFDYTIVAGNNSADLDYASTNALVANGGTFQDTAGNNAVLTLATPGAANSLGANKNIIVDTSPPTFSGASGTSADSDTQITVSWGAASDVVSASANISYEVCYSTVSGTCATTFTANGGSVTGATSLAITGLSEATTYYFVVRATDEAGLTDANTVEQNDTTLENGAVVTAVEYYDTDGNGRIDHARVTFDKNVDTSTFDGYVGADQLNNVSIQWSVAGYTGVRLDTRDTIDGGAAVLTPVIWLAFNEVSSGYDTSVMPDLTAVDASLRDLNTCYIMAPAVQCANQTYADINTIDASEIDKADPVLVSVESEVGQNILSINFSEDVSTYNGGGCNSGTGDFSGGELSYNDNSGGDASNITGMDSDITACGDAKVTVTTDNNLQSPDVISDTINANLTSIYDASANELTNNNPKAIRNRKPIFDGDFSIATIGSDSLELSWNPAFDFITPTNEIVYEICESTVQGSCLSSFTTNYITVAGQTSYTVTGLAASTSYYYVIRARDTDIPANYSNLSQEKVKATADAGEIFNEITLGDFGIFLSGNIPTNPNEVWYYFQGEKGVTYTVNWDDSDDGGGSETADVIVTAMNSDQSVVYFSGDRGYSSGGFPIRPNENGPVYLRIISFDGVGGTFRIMVTDLKADHESGIYSGSINVSLSSNMPASNIYYTMDGSNPTVADTLYTGSIAISADTTLKYFVTDLSFDSAIATKTYSIGTIPTAMSLGVPVVGNITADDQIDWYSIDMHSGYKYDFILDNYWLGSGSYSGATKWSFYKSDYEPIEENLLYSFYTNPYHLTSSETGKLNIKVIPEAPSATGSYSITAYLAGPEFNLDDSDIYTTSQQLELNHFHPDATIIYTDDGTDPTSSGTAKTYAGPITISASTTIQAFAKFPIPSGLPDSMVQIREYRFDPLPTDSTYHWYNLNRGEDMWIYFTATASSEHEIYFGDYWDTLVGTETADIVVSVYHEDRTTLFTDNFYGNLLDNMDYANLIPLYILPSVGENVYLHIKGYNTDEAGSFTLQVNAP